MLYLLALLVHQASASPTLLATLPLVPTRNVQPEVRVSVNGVATTLTVDTGSGYTVVTPAFAKKAKLKLGAPGEDTDAWGNKTITHAVNPTPMKFENWSQAQTKIIVEDLPAFDEKVPGILGPHNLDGVDLYAIDFPNQLMTLWQLKDQDDIDTWAHSQFPNTKFEPLELFTSLGPTDQEGGVTYTNAKIDNKPKQPMLIDTGAKQSYFSEDYVEPDEKEEKDSGQSASGKTTKEKQAHNKTLYLGQKPINLNKIPLHKANTMKGLKGVIGVDILKETTLIITKTKLRVGFRN